MSSLQTYLLEAFEKYIDNIAIITGEGRKIYYDELFERTKKWYCFIKECYGSEKRIIIKLANIEDTIVAMLACLLSNNTFIPLENQRTEVRERQVKEVINNFVEINDRNINEESELVFEIEKFNLNIPTYIYFTSGTTGKPKGVLGKNTSLLHYVLWEIKEFGINEKDRFGQITNVMFDPFLRDVFVPLFSGATIIIRPKLDIVFSSHLFSRWIKDKAITCIHCTPSVLNMSLSISEKNNLISLRYLFLAGEKILTLNVKEWIKIFPQHTIFVNLYGPTETTLAKCFHVIDKEREYDWIVPVGRPIADESVYILTCDGDECEPCELGEVCIDMKYGSWGYIDGILVDKFEKNIKKIHQLIYHTGDIGYYDKGEFVIVGRKDRQVKLNGIRIELEGLENLIQQNDYVENVAVTFAANKLIIFIVLKAEIDNYVSLIKQQILESLSIRTLKCKIIRVNTIEITDNGKKDYKRLSAENYDHC